jgi:hypothetical protein
VRVADVGQLDHGAAAEGVPEVPGGVEGSEFNGAVVTQPEIDFDGATFDPARDGPRLAGQLARVYAAVKGGRWWTLADLAAAAGGSEAGVSARLRDLRKPKFGGHRVERRRVGGGLWEYRVAGEGES